MPSTNSPRRPNPRPAVIILLAIAAVCAWLFLRPARHPATSSTASSATGANATTPALPANSAPTTSPSASPASSQPLTTLNGQPSNSPAAPSPSSPAASAPSPAPLPAVPEIDYATQYILINGHRAHPTRLLAKFKSDDPSGQRDSLLQPLQLHVATEYALTPRTVVLDTTSTPPAPVSGPDEARTRGDAMQDRIKLLLQSGRFEYVEPDYLRSIKATPSDQAFSTGSLWALRNTGQSGGVSGADIDAVRAWDLTTGSTSTVVAIIDTGIRYTHTDLAAQMWQNPGEIPGNGIDDDRDGYIDNVYGIDAITNSGNPADDHGHGTHCAGTIGASANSGGQIVGVAWQVRLMACRFMRKVVDPVTGQEGASGSDSDAIKCINFAVSKGVRVLSNSWGGGGFNTALRDSISAARNQGVLFLAAAGNGGSDGIGDNNDTTPQYPASYNVDNIIAVAAIDRQDKLASFSNYGATSVDIGAPGVAILSSIRTSDTAYASWDGTSMATPHVAGVAALVVSRYPSISVSELRQRILGGAVPIAALRDKTTTGGRLNAFNAVNATADGVLEITLTPPAGTQLIAGNTVSFFAQITDLSAVTNATVVGVVSGQPDIPFSNSGSAPDLTAGDHIYSASIAIPANATSFSLRLDVSAPGKSAGTTTFVFPVIPPVANDQFANAIPFPSSASPSPLAGSNTGASKESGEPNHAGNPGGKSVWWKWTAPSSGTATIKTDGSSFDTVLGIYTGPSVSSLITIASDDDSGVGSASSATFNAINGTTYFIAVDGYDGASGTTSVNVALSASGPAPTNDDFSSAIPLAGTATSTAGSNLNATKQTGEPNHAGNPGGKSVWWSWTAPATGTATIATDGSAFDTTLAIYTGTAVNALTLVANDNDSGEGPRSLVTFNTTSGTTYRIAVDGLNAVSGSISLSIAFAIPPATPPNDNFAARSTLSGSTASASGSNRGATREPGEPDHAGNSGGGSVWWSWTAPSSGSVTLTTTGSDFDTLLAVYTGSNLATLTSISSNNQDPSGGNTSRLSFTATAGTTYQVAVDGANTGLTVASGNIVLALSLGASQSTSNDNLANRTTLSGSSISTTGSNEGATKESGEPAHAGNAGGKSVWWSWTAPSSGSVTIKTDGSSFDTLLAIYTGSEFANLSSIASDDDSGAGSASSVTFNTTTGFTYLIAVDGYSGASGSISLSISLGATIPAAANNNFANRTVIATAPATVTGNNNNATRETGEPSHDGFLARKSVWWTWTAPTSGTATFTTTGSTFDTILAIYTGTTLATLTPVASNDEDPSGGSTSRVLFSATAGTTYQIAVDGYQGASGSITLNLTLGPPAVLPANDNFSGRIILSGTSASDTASNVLATKQSGEPRHAGYNGGRSLWWTWTAPAAGTVTINTSGTTFDSLLAIYTGASVSSLFPVAASNNDPAGGTTSRVTFATAAGTTYQIAVDGYGGAFGDVSLNIVIGPPSSPPPNDDFSNRIPISTISTPTTGSNLLSSRQTSEPNHADVGGTSVWWSWTAPTSASVTITTTGSNFDTMLGVYTGNAISILTLIASNDEDPEGQYTSRVTFNAIAGTTYQIAVDGYYRDAGSITLNILLAPPNDLFANRITLTGTNPSTTGTNAGATSESGEPAHALLTGGKSVWWSWTAPASGAVSVSTAGSSFDTLLAIYTGTTVNALTRIAYNDQDPSGGNTSRLSFPATAGTSYRIAVDGFFGESGSISLTLAPDSSATLPVVAAQPQSQSLAIGSSTTVGLTATGAGLSYTWELNGYSFPTINQPSLSITGLQPIDAGIFRIAVNNAAGTTTSNYAILGLTTTAKVAGAGTEVGPNIRHPNGNLYDQILLTGNAATITADPGQVTRISYIDLTDDIVQVEFSGPGSLTITLDLATGPSTPLLYNQPTVQYMKGHASLVLAGATENTHLSLFTVGTLTAVNPALFKPGVTYDGVADVARVSILSPTGRMGSLRMANTQFFDIRGPSGIYAPGVRIGGPANIHEITAMDSGTSHLVTGLIDSGQVNITGGSMFQFNGRAVQIGDLQKIQMAAGVDSHNRPQPVQVNQARYERNGLDVTSQVLSP